MISKNSFFSFPITLGCLAGILTGLGAATHQPAEDGGDGYYWWRGNLHTHTLWSDGDGFPESVVDWYKENGYHFLALSDHNILSEGEKWVNPETTRSFRGHGEEIVARYLERFGEDWVDIRVVDEELHAHLQTLPATGGHSARRPPDDEIEIGTELVRLKPLNEFRHLFEEPGRFIMIQAEEITDFIHVNATNLVEFIPIQRGSGAREVLENNLAAVMEQRERIGQPIMAHLNHPNWRWRVTAEDMAPVEDLRFYEVFNGHRNSFNYGDETHKSLERMWDIVLTLRLGEKGLGLVYGLGVDDSHNYDASISEVSLPGRGWVMVRSKFLTPEHLIRAMEAGDFYSSSGVTLRKVDANNERLAIEIDAEDGVEYVTEFIGTRLGYDPSSEPVRDEEGNELPVTRKYSNEIGVVLDRVEGPSPTYTFDGDELYVRAVVISSKPQENHYKPDDLERAWVQPVAVAKP